MKARNSDDKYHHVVTIHRYRETILLKKGHACYGYLDGLMQQCFVAVTSA